MEAQSQIKKIWDFLFFAWTFLSFFRFVRFLLRACTFKGMTYLPQIDINKVVPVQEWNDWSGTNTDFLLDREQTTVVWTHF